jgi:putative ABC transport system permease protein
MKLADLIKTAIAATFRSKLRTTLTVVAIFIGAFTLSITSAIGTGVSDYINTQVASVGATNVMTVTKTSTTTTTSDGPQKYNSASASSTQGSSGRPGPGGSADAALTTSDISKIKSISGVLSVSPSVQVSPDYIQYASHGKYVPSLSDNGGLTKADLAAGGQLDNLSSKAEILIPTTYVKSLGLSSSAKAVGKTVTIGITNYSGVQTRVNAVVIGVQNTTLFGSGADANTALTTALEQNQAVGKPATIKTDYASAQITFKKNATSAEVDHLKSLLTKHGYTGETVADQLGTFETVINAIVGVLDAFAVIALIAAGFGIINTLLMSVQERTREIGLMKAMGMGGGRIYALFSFEAIFIGFLGSAIGAGAAIGVGTLISGILAGGLLSALPGLHILQFSVASIATIVGVVMLIAFLAGTLPARRAARQNPIDALRYE